MIDDELRENIKKIALQNAIKYNGKASSKIVLTRTLATNLEFKNKINELRTEVDKIVREINNITRNEQNAEIQKYRIVTNVIKSNTKLPPLKNLIRGKLKTRFSPEPNGYLHIGHAKAAIINDEYTSMYNGEIILRIDDTNPINEKLEYYNAIEEDLKWLNIEFNNVKNSSDDIELMYERCKQLIRSDAAYVCTCQREIIQTNRYKKKSCGCRTNTEEQNYKKWNFMFNKYKTGEAIIRFRGDMESNNTVMRDPVLFRISDGYHPILKTKYRVWPSYDFAVAIEDSLDGITHAFRSKEYELRNELYYKILNSLKMRKPEILEFSRLELKGMPVSKRKIKSLIESKKISGYDDPRLSTLRSMKRRGIVPISIRKFILSLGFTKSNTLAPFDVLESINRKIIDPNSIRLHMVKKPKKINIIKIPFKKIHLHNYPSTNKKRLVTIHENFYLEYEDAIKLKINSKIRLIGIGNINIIKIESDCIYGEFIDDVLDNSIKKIQWVSENDIHKLKITIPKEIFINDKFNEDSLIEISSYTETHYLKLNKNDMIQFVRFGYCRKDSDEHAIYCHK